MKTANLIVITLLYVAFAAYAKNDGVPKGVQATFAKKFPNAQKVKWEKENETEWEANFRLNEKKYSANFDNEGNWKETEYEIKESEIPALVKKKIDKEFAGYNIEEAEISETSNGKVYEFELKKGKTVIEASISPEGNIVQKEESGENEDSDK